MPLPKGIYSDPAVRERWIMERQSLLDRYDALVEGGASKEKAARQLGRTVATLSIMRAGLENLEHQTTGDAKGERIDLGLALLSLVNPPGAERQALSAAEIGAWCGCSHAAIQHIERRALRKLRRKLNALLREQVVSADFGGDRLPALLSAAA